MALRGRARVSHEPRHRSKVTSLRVWPYDAWWYEGRSALDRRSPASINYQIAGLHLLCVWGVGLDISEKPKLAKLRIAVQERTSP